MLTYLTGIEIEIIENRHVQLTTLQVHLPSIKIYLYQLAMAFISLSCVHIMLILKNE